MNKIIFWDFDGVIGDTFDQCLAISRLAYPNLQADDYRRLFEGNINKAERPAPVREIDFSTEFEKTILNAPIIPGMKEVLHELSRDYANVIISSTVSSLINKYLKHNGLDHYFAEIMGNDVAYSKVEKFKIAFEKHGTSNEHSVLVTDTLGDIREAHEVDLPAIGVLWGFQTRETLEKGNPKALVEKPSELSEKIKGLLER